MPVYSLIITLLLFLSPQEAGHLYRGSTVVSCQLLGYVSICHLTDYSSDLSPWLSGLNHY